VQESWKARTCAGLVLPAVVFASGSYLTLLALGTITVYVLGQYDPIYGADNTWQLAALFYVPVAVLHTVGFLTALSRIPMVIGLHVRRLAWFALVNSVVCAGLPTYLFGMLSLILVPLVTGLVTWASLRWLISRAILIAKTFDVVCQNCGYDLTACVSPHCPECGAACQPSLEDSPKV